MTHPPTWWLPPPPISDEAIAVAQPWLEYWRAFVEFKRVERREAAALGRTVHDKAVPFRTMLLTAESEAELKAVGGRIAVADWLDGERRAGLKDVYRARLKEVKA